MRLCGVVAGTMLLTLLSINAPGASRADPQQLPKAAAQVPAFQQFPGRSLAAGGRYRDPVSNVWITKLTDATTPAPNENGLHHYASGPVQISAEWGTQSHTINVTAAGTEYLVDYQRGGSLSNWRRASFIGADLTFGFSFNSTTARLAYYVRDRVLHCYDTEKMAPADRTNFPKSFARECAEDLLWLQYDKSDRWFVMMTHQSGKIIAWNSETNQTLTQSIPGVDEPHLERDGRFVLVALDNDWLIWNLTNNRLGAQRQAPFRGHPGAVRSFFVASDGNNNPAILWRYDPATEKIATLYSGEQIGNGGQHRGDQWVMSDAELDGNLAKQWFVQTVHDEGAASAGPWRLHEKEIHVAQVAGWGSVYGKPAIGIRGVRQFRRGDQTQFEASLKEVASLNAMREGAFYYDRSETRIYVWLIGGGTPTDRVEIKAPALLHDGIALCRLDGSDIRLVAHHYSLNAEAQYHAMPKATISPDGKLIIFSSNMNDSDGRVDVFAAEVPTR